MELEAELVRELRERGFWLTTVESCTGGRIADLVTNVAGASEALWGSTVAYTLSSKTSLLGVAPELLVRYGAVSEETARALAEGGLAQLTEAMPGSKGRICISTTGVAGPGGGDSRNPVGTCFLGLSASGHATRVIRFQAPFGQPREANKAAFARRAIEITLELVRTMNA